MKRVRSCADALGMSLRIRKWTSSKNVKSFWSWGLSKSWLPIFWFWENQKFLYLPFSWFWRILYILSTVQSFLELCANNLWNFPSKLWNLFSTVLSRWVHPKNSLEVYPSIFCLVVVLKKNWALEQVQGWKIWHDTQDSDEVRKVVKRQSN